MQELIVAACLVLVIEGVMPFVAPEQWRRAMLSLAAMPTSQLRTMGLLSMLIGVALLYVLN